MPISAEHSLVPYDPVKPFGFAAHPARRPEATVNRGLPGRYRERTPDPRPAAKSPAPPGFPHTYSARRTVEPPRPFATGLMVDVFA
jgi:hypothetical protein